MKIEVFYFQGCPNHPATTDLVKDVVRELQLADAVVEEVEVHDAEEAVRLRFLGSPSVHVDGIDVEPGARESTAFAFGCRVYGQSGLPSREMVRAALVDAARGRLGNEAPDGSPLPKPEPSRFGLFAVGGALVAAALASACCLLPLALVGVGLSAAGVAVAFAPFRPLFLAVTLLLLGGAFYVTYFRKPVCAPGQACAVPNPKLQRFNRSLLWVATLAAGAFALFPAYAGSLLGAGAPLVATAGAENSSSIAFRLDGMTCGACAARAEKALRSVAGVTGASVSYQDGRALVVVDPNAPPSNDALIRAIEGAGYKAVLEDGDTGQVRPSEPASPAVYSLLSSYARKRKSQYVAPVASVCDLSSFTPHLSASG